MVVLQAFLALLAPLVAPQEVALQALLAFQIPYYIQRTVQRITPLYKIFSFS